MDPSTFENLHNEHQHWLSELTFWQDEVKFLKKLCMSLDNKNGFKIDEYLNKLAHHDRMLNSMKIQIISHENFLKDMLIEDGQKIDGSSPDHDHNREHMAFFNESFNKLKKEIFKISHHSFH